MAGIGFELKKLFGDDDVFTERLKAYMYSTIISAGPWIVSVLTLNVFMILAERYFQDITQKDLFMGTVIYVFIFSQIFLAPWQYVVIRYISDKLYMKKYEFIRPSMAGISKIVIIIDFIATFLFYYNKNLPIYFKITGSALFIVTTLIWVIMMYISAIRNYEIVTRAYVIGSLVAIGLAVFLIKYPIYFVRFQEATNILIAYTLGMLVLYGILLFSFLKSFDFGNDVEFEFITYIKKFPVLFLIGIFYTWAVWGHAIVVWFSKIGITIQNTYRFAPLYDNAYFFAYLTTMPSIMLFVVMVETKFYDVYRKYYSLISSKGNYEKIEQARVELKKVIYRQVIYLMEIQTVLSVTLVVISKEVLSLFNFPSLQIDIFRITALGALCNILIMVVNMIFLYFEFKIQSLIISSLYFVGNIGLTIFFLGKGNDFLGFGYFVSSFIVLIVTVIFLVVIMKDLTYYTFFKQPMFHKEKKNILDWFFVLFEHNPKKIIIEDKKRKTRHIFTAFIFAIILVWALVDLKDAHYYHRLRKKRIEKRHKKIEAKKEKTIIGRETKSWSKESIKKEE